MIVGMRVFKHIFVNVSKAFYVDNSFGLDLNGNNMKWHCNFGSFRFPANLLYFFVLFPLFGGVHFFPTFVCKINVFVLAKHRTHIGRWSSLAWNPMHHTTIHKKYIKFKFCWNLFLFFFFGALCVGLFALCYISLFNSFWCSEYWWCCCFSICLLGYMYVCVICGGASGMSESHRGASNCHWCRSFMRTNIIFIHSIELCSWLPEKFLPLNSGVSSFSHTNAKRF